MTLPVTLDDAKRQLRVTGNAQDDEIQGFILDAAGWVEEYTGHILEPRTVTEQFNGIAPVKLRAWPISADAAFGLAYLDGAGAPVAATGSRLDVSSRPARVLPPYGHFWPFPQIDQLFTVTVEAGYADPVDVPRNFVRAILVLISAYDDDREGGETFQAAEATARRLCRGKKAWRL